MEAIYKHLPTQDKEPMTHQCTDTTKFQLDEPLVVPRLEKKTNKNRRDHQEPQLQCKPVKVFIQAPDWATNFSDGIGRRVTLRSRGLGFI